MEFHQLRSFIAVAEEGRLSRAAEKLFTSQPAVSSHIKSLEEELGVSLFVRTPRGMLLTSEGMAMLEKARTTIHSAEDLLSSARDLRETCAGEFRLGINTDSQFLRVAELLEVLGGDYPDVQAHPLRSTSALTPHLIQDGRLDGGYIYGPPPATGVEGFVVCEVGLSAAAPLAFAERLQTAGWKEVAAMPWIWVTEECLFHEAGSRAFQAHGVAPSIVGKTDDEEILLSLVIAGKGLALLREDDAKSAADNGEVAVWPHPVTRIPVSYLYARDSANKRLCKAVLDSVRKVWNRDDLGCS